MQHRQGVGIQQAPVRDPDDLELGIGRHGDGGGDAQLLRAAGLFEGDALEENQAVAESEVGNGHGGLGDGRLLRLRPGLHRLGETLGFRLLRFGLDFQVGKTRLRRGADRPLLGQGGDALDLLLQGVDLAVQVFRGLRGGQLFKLLLHLLDVGLQIHELLAQFREPGAGGGDGLLHADPVGIVGNDAGLALPQTLDQPQEVPRVGDLAGILGYGVVLDLGSEALGLLVDGSPCGIVPLVLRLQLFKV